jgi:hypothetical protein
MNQRQNESGIVHDFQISKIKSLNDLINIITNGLNFEQVIKSGTETSCLIVFLMNKQSLLSNCLCIINVKESKLSYEMKLICRYVILFI